MAEIRITELDFDAIKNNLKNYLRANPQFSDYDFEGSGLSVLLEVLAYNTHYNAMLAHLATNEMFLDSAIKRSSVVSHAKALGYVPRSAIASTAVVDVIVRPTGTPPATLVLDRTVAFVGSVQDQTFTFYPDKVYTADYNPVEGTYTFVGVRLKEGVRSLSKFVVESDTRSGPFVLENQNIDISTIDVLVKDSADSLESTAYKYSTTIIDVTDQTPVFWLEESHNGLYKVLFGDGIIGKQLDVGNIVSVTYLVCQGNSSANGIRSFVLSGSIGGFTSVSLRITQASAGGAPPESVDSIRFNAPRFNATRNRAVTVQDYKSLLLANYPYIKGISVWGGEDNNPPIYGKVFVSIDPIDGYVVTNAEKEHIVTTILKPRSMLGIQHEFVDPDYLYIGLTVDVEYDPLKTRLASAALETLVRDEIVRYFNNEVTTLSDTFHYSRLIRYIDTSNPAIISSQVGVRLQKRVVMELNMPSFVNVNFITKIAPSSLYTSNFYTQIAGVTKRVTLKDDGVGNVSMFEVGTNLLVQKNIGTVDYAYGRVLIPSLLKTGDISTVADIRFYTTPAELSYNIAPAIVSRTESVDTATYPYPAQNVVLKLDDSVAVSVAGIATGLQVSARATR
jgi:hypothetical protein